MKQHKTPCAACPFRRTALNGWLGGLTPDEFGAMAQSETRMPCHTRAQDGFSYLDPTPEDLKLPQCAGRAIHWANQLKTRRDKSLLELPADRETAFTWPSEFVEHHKQPLKVRATSVL